MGVVPEDRLDKQRVLFHIKIEADRAGVGDVALKKLLRIFDLDLFAERRQHAAAEGRKILPRQIHGLLLCFEQRVDLFPKLARAA